MLNIYLVLFYNNKRYVLSVYILHYLRTRVLSCFSLSLHTRSFSLPRTAYTYVVINLSNTFLTKEKQIHICVKVQSTSEGVVFYANAAILTMSDAKVFPRGLETQAVCHSALVVYYPGCFVHLSLHLYHHHSSNKYRQSSSPYHF